MSTQCLQDGPSPGRPLIRRPRRAAASALVVGLVLCGTFAGSASAAVPGLQRVTASFHSSSTNPKKVTAVCPAGKEVLGAGGEVNGATGQVVIDDLTPNAGLTGVEVAAYEDDDGTAANWTLTGYAICANPVPGSILVTALSAFHSSVSGTSVTATCPAGKKLVGTGGDINGAFGEVVMDDIRPSPTLSSVTVRGFEDENGTAANWFVRAHAICANPLPGLKRIVATGVSNSVTGSDATAVCPPGRKLIGTGGDFTGAVGQVVMDDIRPSSTLTSLRITGFEDDNGTAANWTTHAYGICATA